MTKINLVIARYNEDINYINQYKNDFNIILYNKGPKIELSDIQIIDLPNIGREFHTFLYHIINNYDNLVDLTIFLPGSWQLPGKLNRALETIKNAKNTKTTVIITESNLKDIKNLLFNFTLDEWGCTDHNNRKLNPDRKLLQSSVRPFGKWYENYFNHINSSDIKAITYFGICAIDKKHILQNPIDIYKKLYNELNTHNNPEVGHYMERAWSSLFYPYPDSCIFYDDTRKLTIL